MTDPRYLDASAEQMLTTYWEHHYDDAKRSGRPEEEEFENEDFEDEVAALIAQAEAAGDEEWETVIGHEGG